VWLTSQFQEGILEKKSRNQNKISLLFIGLGVGVVIGATILLLLGNLDLSSFSSLWHQAQAAYTPADIDDEDQQALDFSLLNLAGNRVTLKSLHGRIVVLNFWATWCGPCRLEMPIFQDYHVRYSPDLVILGVNLQESPLIVQEFVDQFSLTYEILLDPNGDTSSLYQVYMLPNSFFIDKQGNIRYHHIGTMSEEQFVYYLKQVGIGEDE
jgi:cytochrome c biogenesis protein CcmG/thiol:disulfide interchange protein DsbE